MVESKRGVHQIDKNSFLFFNSPEIFYSLTFELVESNKIRLFLLKILESDTYIYQGTFPFEFFGTGEVSPDNTIKNLNYLIYNNYFMIKEQPNKMNILLNSKKRANIELLMLPLVDNNQDKDLYFNEQINLMQNKINELINVVSTQEQQIKEMKNTEESHINIINGLEKKVNDLFSRLDNENMNQNNNIIQNNNNNNSNNYDIYKTNNSNNPYNINNSFNRTTTYNPYSINNSINPYNKNNSNNAYGINNSNQNNNFNNPYSINNTDNEGFRHNRAMTIQFPNSNNLNNNNNSSFRNNNNFKPF